MQSNANPENAQAKGAPHRPSSTEDTKEKKTHRKLRHIDKKFFKNTFKSRLTKTSRNTTPSILRPPADEDAQNLPLAEPVTHDTDQYPSAFNIDASPDSGGMHMLSAPHIRKFRTGSFNSTSSSGSALSPIYSSPSSSASYLPPRYAPPFNPTIPGLTDDSVPNYDRENLPEPIAQDIGQYSSAYNVEATPDYMHMLSVPCARKSRTSSFNSISSSGSALSPIYPSPSSSASYLPSQHQPPFNLTIPNLTENSVLNYGLENPPEPVVQDISHYPSAHNVEAAPDGMRTLSVPCAKKSRTSSFNSTSSSGSALSPLYSSTFSSASYLPPPPFDVTIPGPTGDSVPHYIPDRIFFTPDTSNHPVLRPHHSGSNLPVGCHFSNSNERQSSFIAPSIRSLENSERPNLLDSYNEPVAANDGLNYAALDAAANIPYSLSMDNPRFEERFMPVDSPQSLQYQTDMSNLNTFAGENTPAGSLNTHNTISPSITVPPDYSLSMNSRKPANSNPQAFDNRQSQRWNEPGF